MLAKRHAKAEATAVHATAAQVVGARLLGPTSRIAIGRAVIRTLKAGEVEIGSLKVDQLEVAGRRWPEAP